MPDAEGRPFAGEIAAQIGIKASDWRARVTRGYAPKPVAYVRREALGVACMAAVWDPKQIAEYLAARRERLARRDGRPTDAL